MSSSTAVKDGIDYAALRDIFQVLYCGLALCYTAYLYIPSYLCLISYSVCLSIFRLSVNVELSFVLSDMLMCLVYSLFSVGQSIWSVWSGIKLN